MDRYSSRVVSGVIAVIALVLGSRSALSQMCGDWIAGPGREVPGVEGTVQDLVAWDPDGPGPQPERLVVCGGFTIASDQEAKFVAAWDGSRWSAMGQLPGGGTGWALAVHNGELYLGGEFSCFDNSVRSNLVRWDGAAWRAITPGPYGRIHAIKSFGGSLVMAGDFTGVAEIGGHIARWDGASWRPMGAGLDGGAGVERLEVFNGALYAFGSFTRSGAAGVTGIARWDGAAWNAVGGGVSGTIVFGGPTIHTAHVLNGSLYVGGNFQNAGAVRADGLARWDGSAWSAGYASTLPREVTCLSSFGGALLGCEQAVGTSYIGGPSRSLFMQPATVYRALEWGGSLYVVGAFTRASGADEPLNTGGVAACGIARWDGAAWHALGGGIDSTIDALELFQGDLIAAGRFAGIGGSNARSVARWDGAAWHALGAGFDLGAVSLAVGGVGGDRLYAAGPFARSGSTVVNGVAEWDGTSWRPLGAGVAGATVSTICWYRGELWLASNREPEHNSFECRLSVWDGAAWRTVVDFTPGFVRKMIAYRDVLYIGGTFNGIGGSDAVGIARWDGNAFSNMGSGFTGGVYALYADDGAIYVTRGSRTCIYVWNLEEATWRTVSCNLSSTALSLAFYRGRLVAGGGFHNATTVVTEGLAAWDGRAWSTLGPVPERTVGFPTINALLVYNDELIAAGGFERLGGVPCPNWGRWWSPAADLDDGSGTGRCDGAVGIEDLLFFITMYVNNDPRADITVPRGLVDEDDQMFFLERFFEGT